MSLEQKYQNTSQIHPHYDQIQCRLFADHRRTEPAVWQVEEPPLSVLLEMGSFLYRILNLIILHNIFGLTLEIPTCSLVNQFIAENAPRGDKVSLHVPFPKSLSKFCWNFIFWVYNKTCFLNFTLSQCGLLQRIFIHIELGGTTSVAPSTLTLIDSLYTPNLKAKTKYILAPAMHIRRSVFYG